MAGDATGAAIGREGGVEARSVSVPRLPMSQRADALDFSTIERVLVVKLRYHGDVVLSTPVFQVLANHHPHLEIDALVYADTAELLRDHPAISRVYGVERSGAGGRGLAALRERGGLWRSLRERRYGLLIHLTEHWRGAMLARFLGVRHAVVAEYARRTGHAGWRRLLGGFWHGSFTHHYPLSSGRRHMVERNLDALRRIGIHPDESEKRLVVNVNAHDAELAEVDLRRNGLRRGHYIVIHPASRFGYKCWDPGRMAAVVAALHRPDRPVVLTGSPDPAERAMVDEVVLRSGVDPVDLCGALTLKGLAHCIGGAQLFIGVDSAPMHIAAATGTPVVALFGPSNPWVWGPWQVAHRIVATHPSCQPCHLRGCADSFHSECIERITVAQVLAAVRELLPRGTVAAPPPSPVSFLRPVERTG